MKRQLRSWLWRAPVDQEVAEEIALHLELRTRELSRRGVDPASARDRRFKRMGDVATVKRTCVTSEGRGTGHAIQPLARRAPATT